MPHGTHAILSPPMHIPCQFQVSESDGANETTLATPACPSLSSLTGVAEIDRVGETQQGQPSGHHSLDCGHPHMAWRSSSPASGPRLRHSVPLSALCRPRPLFADFSRIGAFCGPIYAFHALPTSHKNAAGAAVCPTNLPARWCKVPRPRLQARRPVSASSTSAGTHPRVATWCLGKRLGSNFHGNAIESVTSSCTESHSTSRATRPPRRYRQFDWF